MGKSKYEKNYIEGGYLMNYEKPFITYVLNSVVNPVFRLVYAWFPSGENIVFIELYYKGDKET